VVVFDEIGQAIANNLSAGRTDDIADEQNTHG
jgi:hypothetical protein